MKNKKSKKPTSKASKTKKTTVAKKTKPKEVETMDRKALKTIVSQLKDAGTTIKVIKTDTDDLLQKKVNEALQRLPTGDMLKTLESIDPGKLITVLKKDCLGIFIDLSDVSCIRCQDSSACASAFIKNVKGGLDLGKAMPDPKAEKPEAKQKLVPVTKYKEGRLVFVRDVKNPNPKGDDYHDTFQRVLDDQPETLGALRAIIEQDFDIGTDAEFMQFVTAMRDHKEGIIKLDVDLSEANKAELRKAGYDV